MFGLPTFPKFLVLVAVIALVWFWSRRTALQQRSNRGGGQQGQPASGGKNASQPAAANAKQKSIEDLVKCPSCGTYIAAGSVCGCGQKSR
jgi:predicted lipid-binding transport protein (Tim44 family)